MAGTAEQVPDQLLLLESRQQRRKQQRLQGLQHGTFRLEMFLTRIGFGSKVIVTGDLSQKDLPTGQQSGLDVALKVLGGINDIGICMLSSQDVVRHPLVQKIVKAYDDYEAKQKHLSKDGLKKDEAAGARTKRSSVRRKISERGDK